MLFNYDFLIQVKQFLSYYVTINQGLSAFCWYNLN